MKELPNKKQARRITLHAVGEGILKRKNCKVCGKTNAEMHHLDYSKPLKILWLCRKHHCEWHTKHGIPPGIVDDNNFKTVKIDAILHKKVKSLSIDMEISMNKLIEQTLIKITK